MTKQERQFHELLNTPIPANSILPSWIHYLRNDSLNSIISGIIDKRIDVRNLNTMTKEEFKKIVLCG